MAQELELAKHFKPVRRMHRCTYFKMRHFGYYYIACKVSFVVDQIPNDHRDSRSILVQRHCSFLTQVWLLRVREGLNLCEMHRSIGISVTKSLVESQKLRR
jgi:hypothetical protein